VESSSTDDSRLRGALPNPDIAAKQKPPSRVVPQFFTFKALKELS
jgi:hypothetical protein